MSRHDAIAVLPGLQKDNDGPIFREPWEAQAFAMTLLLHEKGLFTWQEWTQVLSDRIAAASETGEPDTGETRITCTGWQRLRHWWQRRGLRMPRS